MSKSSTKSVDDYLIRIKEIVDKLATFYVTIDNDDVLFYTLNGLPAEFNSFRTSIRMQSESVTLDELHSLLKSEAKLIEQQNKAIVNPFFNPISMYANQGCGSNSSNFHSCGRSNQGRGFSLGRSGQGRGSNGNFTPTHTSFTPVNFGRGSNGNSSNNQSNSIASQGCVVCQICNRPGVTRENLEPEIFVLVRPKVLP